MSDIIVKSQSADQACESKPKRPLDDPPSGNEEVKKARMSLDVDALHVDTDAWSN